MVQDETIASGRLAIDATLVLIISVSTVFGLQAQDLLVALLLGAWCCSLIYLPDKIHHSYLQAAAVDSGYVLHRTFAFLLRCAAPFLGKAMLEFFCNRHQGSLICLMDASLFAAVAGLRLGVNLVGEADRVTEQLAMSTDSSGRLALVEREASELRDENDAMKEQVAALQQDLERLRESFQTCVLTVSTHKTNMSERLSQYEEIQQTLQDKLDDPVSLQAEVKEAAGIAASIARFSHSVTRGVVTRVLPRSILTLSNDSNDADAPETNQPKRGGSRHPASRTTRAYTKTR